jgi:signal transduction histidine kinase
MKKISDGRLLEEVRRRFEEKSGALRELEETLRQLRDVNEKLRASEELKSRFLSNIRNEIYNPLSSIMALSETIMSIEAGKNPAVADSAALMHAEARELDFQLGNIFLAAELEAGEAAPDISKVRVRSLVDDAVDSTVKRLKNRTVDIKVTGVRKDSAETFATDAGKLWAALINIISNAVEFSRDGGSVIVDIKIADAVLTISVRDFGAGIAPGDLELVFERFKQLDSGSTKQHRGHGLGLSVTRAALEIIGGSVSAESEPGKGSVFTVSVPESDQAGAPESLSGNEEIFGGDGGVEMF